MSGIQQKRILNRVLDVRDMIGIRRSKMREGIPFKTIVKRCKTVEDAKKLSDSLRGDCL